MNALKVVDDAKKIMTRNSPEILMGIGIMGMVSSTVMAVRATPKALILIEEEKRRINGEILESTGKTVKVRKLRPIDTVKVTWKCYIPAAVMAGISIGCLVGASKVNMRRNAALATAYAVSESTLKAYQKKVLEVIGEKKDDAIRDAVAKERVEKHPVKSSEVIITGSGDTLCYDVLSGRYFKSDIEKLRRTENELNRRLRDEIFISLNEFYYEIGLDGIKIGDDVGWNIDNGYVEMNFSSQLAADGTPCLVVDYLVGPEYDYRRKMY